MLLLLLLHLSHLLLNSIVRIAIDRLIATFRLLLAGLAIGRPAGNSTHPLLAARLLDTGGCLHLRLQLAKVLLSEQLVRSAQTSYLQGFGGFE